MRKMFVSIAAVVVVLGAGVITASASPENPSRHIVEVVKVVEGDELLTENASFTVEIDCGVNDYDLVFDDDGGTQSVEVGTWLDGPQTCTIAETDDGGATTVEIDPNVCEFPGKEESSASIIEEPIFPDVVCVVTVENSFEAPVTTTTVPAPPVIIEQPVLVPTPVVVAPQFTG